MGDFDFRTSQFASGGIVPANPVLRLDRYDAEYQYESLKEYIKAFEAALDDSCQVMFKLASFGGSITMSVERIEYENPSLIIFMGSVNDNPATLIQNVNQLNFLLMAAPLEHPREKRRIGFAAE